MAETIDPQQPGPGQWSKSIDQTHDFELKRYRGYIFEMEVNHFHHDSAVLLPDYEAHHQDDVLDLITSLVVIAKVLRWQEENPSWKILITGHTDRSGSDQYNQELSKLRADAVLAILEGDKEKWKEVCQKKSKVEDYQLVLHFIDRGFDCNCHPGPVDNILGPLTQAGVKQFQYWYNESLGESIYVDGIVGPQTWGAFFDIYELTLSTLVENEEQSLRAKLSFVDGGKKAVGCGENFPTDAINPDHFRSRNDRRVEILFFEPGHYPRLDCHPSADSCNPDECIIRHPRAYRLEILDVEAVPREIHIDLHTVDEFGAYVPSISLKLTPQHGDEETVTTDGSGYWSGTIKAAGWIRVTLSDGTPVQHPGNTQSENPAAWVGTTDEELLPTVHLNPSVTRQVITEILVAKVSEESQEERRQLQRRYGYGSGGQTTIRGGEVGPDEHVEPIGTMDKRGRKEPDDYPKRYSRFYGSQCSDNLFLAAGFESNGDIDAGELTDAMHEWLKDYFPTVVSRGYALSVVHDSVSQLGLYANTGGSTSHEKDYAFRGDVIVTGRVGAYAIFEKHGDSLFRDMASQAGVLAPKLKGDSPGETKPIPGPPGSVPINELLESGDAEDYVEKLIEHMGNRRLHLIYHLPAPGYGLVLAYRGGGTGLLENYPGHDGLNDRIHDRNMAVVESVADAYKDGYLQSYIGKINQTTSHKEMREVGPPEEIYLFPRPAGISDGKWTELHSANAVTSLDAWKAVSDQSIKLWGEKSGGSLFIYATFATETPLPPKELELMKFKGGGVKGGAGGKVEIAWNFEIDSDGRFYQKSEQKAEVEFSLGVEKKGNKVGGGYTLEVDNNGKIANQKAKVEIDIKGAPAAVEAEVDRDGNFAFKLKKAGGTIESSVDLVKAQVKTGGCFSTLDLTKAICEKLDKPVPIDAYPKLCVGMGMQMLRYGTILKVVSGAKGFFEMRDHSEILDSDWSSLYSDERENLAELDWNQQSWDDRKRDTSKWPATCAEKRYVDLSAKQKLAVANMPFPDFDGDYGGWRTFWDGLKQAWGP